MRRRAGDYDHDERCYSFADDWATPWINPNLIDSTEGIVWDGEWMAGHYESSARDDLRKARSTQAARLIMRNLFLLLSGDETICYRRATIARVIPIFKQRMEELSG